MIPALCLGGSPHKRRNSDFTQLGVDPSEAFNPMPNIMNMKSVLHDESVIGSRLLESLTLLRDRHTMHHSKDTMEEFAQNISHSIAVVSHWIVFFLINES